MPKVSIVVAIWNSQTYLAQCVDSMLNQTFSDFELILVDDGSTDKTSKICDKYQKSDKRVRVIHQKNGGQTNARQNGLKIAKGDYVLIFDSDDWLELNALEVMVEAAEKNDADIVTFNGYFNYTNHQCPVRQPVKSGFFDKEGLKEYIYPTMIFSGRFFYFGIFAAMWNKLFRRELITANLMSINPKVKVFEDGLATFPAFLDAERVCVLGDEFLYHYRDNAPSITRSYIKDQFDSTTLLFNALNEIKKNKQHIYDISTQLDYFYLYVIRTTIVEEYYYRYKKSYIKRYLYLRDIIKDIQTIKVCKRTGDTGMDWKIKLFFVFVRKQWTFPVMIMAILKAYYARLKVYVRREIGRY